MTAVELLLNELEEYDFKVSPSIKKRYLEMEKQQILDAFEEGSSDGYDGWGSTNKEKYYNETYKQ